MYVRTLMRIGFYITASHARKEKWTGESIRTGGIGVSGTDSTFVMFAEHLAGRGHEVCVVSADCAEGVFRGVSYAPSWVTLPNPQALVIPSFYDAGPLPSFSGLELVVVNFACAHRCSEPFPGVPKVGVFPSEWCRVKVRELPWLRESLVIPNPLMTDMMLPPVAKIPKSVAWHTSWERGGAIAERACAKAFGEAGRFVAMDYYAHSELCNATSADKRTVFDVLAESEYFVYPLVLPNGLVNLDTFACCVAEALAHGVLVISWPVAALPEVYGDCISYIEGEIDGSEATVDAIARAIRRLEADPAEKEAIRERGRRRVLDLCAPERACLRLDDIFAAPRVPIGILIRHAYF